MRSAASARQPRSAEEIVRTTLEQRIVEGELQLPVLPTVVMEVVQLTQSSDSSASHLSDLIHRDQTLAGHVLRIANSPLYLPTVAIVSLQQAISRLGMRIIGEIAISLSVKAIVFDVRGYESEVAFLWRKAAASGGFAREIARHLRMSVESALLCGLLQNVGKPILLQLVRETSEQLGEPIGKERVLEMVEEYHTIVGSQMAGAWGLPEVVTTTVHFHHDPASAPKYQDETRITALADILASHLLRTDSGRGASSGDHEGRIPGVGALGTSSGRRDSGGAVGSGATDRAAGSGGADRVAGSGLAVVAGGAAGPAGSDPAGAAGASVGPAGSDSGDAASSRGLGSAESLEETAARLVRDYPDFAELGMYPEDVVQLLGRSDQIRETVETFS